MTGDGGIRWQVRPECREQLLGPGGLRLDEWLREGRARVVKHGPHRTVYRVDLPGLSCHVKHNRLANLRARLRELIRPSKARIEHERALAVAARGVPTITPLGVGESADGRPGDSFLITRSLLDTEPLQAFLERTLPTFAPARQARVRQRLAKALGEFLGRMHEAGVVHHDLHAGNLLVHLGAGDVPRLYLIDLQAVRLGGPLGWRASRDNLVLLNRWLSLRASRSDRLRCWKAYCAERGAADGATRARELERATWRSSLSFWARRDRRCLGNNRYFRRVRAAGVVGHAVTDLDRAALAALLADPDEPFRRPGVRLLKDSRSSTVAELEMPVHGVPRRVIWKRFRVTAWTDPFAALFRRTPALRSWVMGHALRDRDLPTPRPLLVLHRRRRGLLREGYLLVEKVDDAADLHAALSRLACLPAAERRAELRRRIEQVARLARELHRRRLSHRDLKAANVLLTPPDAAWLIDLVGVRKHGKLRRSRQVRDLVRLHASFWQSEELTRTDKLRFLRVYLQWGLTGRARWKRWWRDIEQATREKVRRNARSGRPLA
ncbi:MAG TPA: lipopolysaccharide kinase InaA family protein [Gemmataceae bacterium]|nr:lipopolysaccharide kinase InaA family protein [Gemmataceae bacterium]